MAMNLLPENRITYCILMKIVFLTRIENKYDLENKKTGS